MSNLADETLMQLYASGDVQAFNRLYQRHKGSLYRYFTRQCSSIALAEELYQQVWSKLIKARSNYTVQSKFTTYLYRIAHNELVDHYRRMQHYNENNTGNEQAHSEINTLASEQPSHEELLNANQQAQQLKLCLQQLPLEQKEAFLLKHEASLTLTEIANLLDEPSEGIKSRIRYAVSKLKHCLSSKLRSDDE